MRRSLAIVAPLAWWLCVVPLAGAAPPTGPKAAPGAVVYRSAFADGKTDGWSGDKPLPVDRAAGTLGRLHNQTARLTLDELPEHRFLHVSLDLHVIESWDGCFADADGPDTLTLRLDDGRVLLQTTFSTAGGKQSYPDSGRWAIHPRRTGEVKRLLGTDFEGSLYSLALTFPHRARRAVLAFTAELTERQAKDRNVRNEAWAIGNVVVRALPAAPVRLDDQGFAKLWADLASSDPLAASRAAWTLVSVGEAAVPRIARAVDPARDPAAQRKIARLIRQLDDDDWRIRQKATAELKALGAAAHGAFRRTLAGKPSMEVCSRIEDILSAHKTPAAEQLRTGRARWVLQVIGGEKALAIRGSLPEPGPAKPSKPAVVPPGGGPRADPGGRFVGRQLRRTVRK